MLTKKKISKSISSELNITYKVANQLTNHFIETISKESQSKTVKINGFGSFQTHKTPQRIGRNPKTKESYIIKPRLKVKLKASMKLKQVLN